MTRFVVLRGRFGVIACVMLSVLAVPPVLAAPSQACHAAPSRAGEWRMMGGDDAGTRNQVAERTIGVAQAATLEPSWATKVSVGGSTGNLNSTPVVANGCVYVGSASGDVAALDATTGKVVWRTHVDVVTPGLGGAIVSAAVVQGGRVFVLINETADGVVGPYAVALDQHTGRVHWRSAPMETHPGSYTNASPAVIPSAGGSVVFAGWSPAEGDPAGQGGFVLLDPATGALVKKTTTIPVAAQSEGHAGGGIWAPPAYDRSTGYAFVGASNPYSKTIEHPNTNAVLKIDLRDRSAAGFGDIVGSFKGVPDQYSEDLRPLLTQSAACEASDNPAIPYPLDDPVCGQLDLDFGSPPNLFTIGSRRVVGALQKAGIYHLFDAATLEPVWRATVGGPCHACNASATAVGPHGVAGVAAPGGIAFMLDPLTGAQRWTAPLGDGSHYQGVSLANGVVYTTDNFGIFHAMDAATGSSLQRRPLALDTSEPMVTFSSSGTAIARGTVFVAANGGSPTGQSGWVIAYRP